MSEKIPVCPHFRKEDWKCEINPCAAETFDTPYTNNCCFTGSFTSKWKCTSLKEKGKEINICHSMFKHGTRCPYYLGGPQIKWKGELYGDLLQMVSQMKENQT